MLIGIDASRTTDYQRTGTEAYAYHLIQAMIPQTAGRHRLRLYFNSSPPPRLFPPADHVEIVPIPFPRLWTHLRLAAELHRRPPDVFFTPAHVIPLTYFRPSVATIHDLGYHFFPDAHTGRQLVYLKWSTRHNARRAKRVLADSEATRRDLIRFYKITPEKIMVVYPGLDPELLIEREVALSSQETREHPYLLFLSTLQPRKNLVRIIRAFGQVAKKIPHILILAGKRGWQMEPIESAIQALDHEIQNRVLMIGFVAEEKKANLIAGADLMLYPSLYEGFGFPLLEANACGTAVIASNTSSLPELAGEGAAYLVDPENEHELVTAILKLLHNSKLRKKMIQKGFENIGRFTWERTAERALEQIEIAAR